METLTGKQRRWLRARAHHLKPVIIMGKGGLSGTVISAIDTALADHELIKVRLMDSGVEKKLLAKEIEAKLQCEVVGIVGHIAICYRESEHPKAENLVLPIAENEEE